MNGWDETSRKLTILIMFALSRICYRIAELFGRIGIKCEFIYRQMVAA